MRKALLELLLPLNDIHDGIAAMGRLYALKALELAKIEGKLIFTKKSFEFIRLAKYIKDSINEGYAIKTVKYVNWRVGVTPDKIDHAELDSLLSDLSGSLYWSIMRLIDEVKNDVALLPFSSLLNYLRKHLKATSTSVNSLSSMLGDYIDTSINPVKRCQGPMHVEIDPVFVPMDSLLHQPSAIYGDSISEAIPYYWGLSARECLASDMCALSIVEYDHIPIEFYVDMAKQSYDEIRHAKIFLDIAVELIPVLKTYLTENDKLYRHIIMFEQSGVGLPVAAERHLYEAMWNASLDERLVLMHHDTETGGIKRLREKSNSSISQQYPAIGYQLDIVMHEEITHARLGNNWLNYLLPNMKERRHAFDRARLLRSLLLLTSSSYHLQVPLMHLVDQVDASAH